jgi:rhodanese-related sulfurtransferase
MKKRLLFLAFVLIYLTPVVQGQIFEDLTAIQADSLIMANTDNPDFVVLDVRTPGEYDPQHLEGAINRDYYDSDFDQQLNVLPKHKKYLIHCRSGSRSNQAMNVMYDLGFEEVYNMLGGINAWNSNGFPVTYAFAPMLMMVSDSVFELKEISLGSIDTIQLKVTNRANALLIFEEICSLDQPEFSTDFDPNTTLPGAFDYTFSIFYEPVDEEADSLSFCILSDAGNIEVNIFRTGVDETSSSIALAKDNSIKIFPNPVRKRLHIDFPDDKIGEIQVYDVFGSALMRTSIAESKSLDTSSLKPGHYLISLRTEGRSETLRFVKVE